MSDYFCQLCGQPLQGRSKRIRHAHWSKDRHLQVCMDCYRDKPRCQACDLPMAAPSANGLCLTCTEVLPTCLTCGKRIKGRYWEVDGVGPYCDRCRRERPACDVCGAPMGDERWQLSDGRVFCESCHASGIFTPQEAAALYAETQVVIAKIFGLNLNIPTGLSLVDRNQLAQIIQEQSNGTLQMDLKHTLGIYARKGMRRGIYMQTGLPRPLFIQVAAHEFAHAWQGENCPLLRDPLLHEGFAEWVAYRLVEHYGYTSQMDRMKERQDIYGRGMQMILDMEAREGIPAVLEACRKTR